MENLQPISDAEQVAFSVGLAKQRNILRRKDHLCDVTLVTKDDKGFKSHRNVLSAARLFLLQASSGFFRATRKRIEKGLFGLKRFGVLQ